MIEYIEKILTNFRTCFTRESAYQWFEIISSYAPLFKEGDYTVLIGDGVKQAKEGKYMPGVKKLFQEFENSSKPEFIFGHMFGGIGVLSGNTTKWFCIPLHINLQDGIQTILSWKNKEEKPPSHVVQGYKILL